MQNTFKLLFVQLFIVLYVMLRNLLLPVAALVPKFVLFHLVSIAFLQAVTTRRFVRLCRREALPILKRL